MLEPILAAVVPVLITTAIGFGWVRFGRGFETATLTLLLTDVGTPCLVFSTLVNTAVPADAFAHTALASVAAILGFAVSGVLVLTLAHLPLRPYLPSLAFPNAGNLGLPLALYAFGAEGLGYAIVFFSVCSVTSYTIGQAITAGSANYGAMLRMPLLYAVALGIVASIWRLVPPPWLGTSISLLGSMTVPLMLLMLGASLARLRVQALPRAVLLSAVRLGLGTAIGWAAATLFGLHGTAKAALILQSSMPVAVYNYLFALRWNNHPEEIAGLVVVSTCAAICTAPLLLYCLMG